jgi:hypothetical protein
VRAIIIFWARMNFEYIVLRIVRRYLPEAIVSLLLKMNLILKPGLETANPQAAFDRYNKEILGHGRSVVDKNILIFGYGGYIGTAAEFIRHSARHVFVYDKFCKYDERKNSALLRGRGIKPDAITIIDRDLRRHFSDQSANKMDIVVSSSVLEHVDTIEEEVEILTAITAPGGFHIHYIDLRDHFFKYPFAMLCFTEKSWITYLNPKENLNRLRMPDFQRCFAKFFRVVQCRIEESNVPAFQKISPRILPKFKCGDAAVDSATQIVIYAEAVVE